jgi:hypothetical protein
VRNQGFINGLWYDPNGGLPTRPRSSELLLSADQIRVGLAGNLADYEFVDRNGNRGHRQRGRLQRLAGRVHPDPQENIVYVVQARQPDAVRHRPVPPPGRHLDGRPGAGPEPGNAIVALAQGVPFFHAGQDMLRSKSLDRDSYNSGDWFNRLDFTYQTNNWGVGLPVAEKNEANWPLIRARGSPTRRWRPSRPTSSATWPSLPRVARAVAAVPPGDRRCSGSRRQRQTVEKQADGNAEAPNRTLVVAWGSDGTQAVDDTVANWRDPIVVSVDPPAGDGGVPIETAVAATWNQAMSAGVTFQVTGPDGPVSGSVAYDGGSFTTTFMPDSDLRPGATYTVVLAGQTDAGGDVQQVPRAWSFTTRDPYATETIGLVIESLAGIDHKKVDKAVEKLEKALDPKYWLSPTRLDPKHGKHVYDELRKAVKELDKVEGGDPDRPLVNGAIETLVMLADSLARDALLRAIAMGGDPKDIAKAREELSRAYAEWIDGDHDKAIDKFGKAWEKATKALK